MVCRYALSFSQKFVAESVLFPVLFLVWRVPAAAFLSIGLGLARLRGMLANFQNCVFRAVESGLWRLPAARISASFSYVFANRRAGEPISTGETPPPAVVLLVCACLEFLRSSSKCVSRCRESLARKLGFRGFGVAS